jgi:hypothetical protein
MVCEEERLRDHMSVVSESGLLLFYQGDMSEV